MFRCPSQCVQAGSGVVEVFLPLGVYYPLGVHQHKVYLHLLIKRIYPRFPFVALRKAGSWLEAALLPLFLLKKKGSRVVFIGTSTLSGTFLIGLKDFVTPLRSVNESGRLFACLQISESGRRVKILEYVGMRRNMKSQLISWHAMWYLKPPPNVWK